MRSRFAGLLLAAVVASATWRTSAYATDRPPNDPWKLYLFRIEFDNDTFLGSDDRFTAGWSLQFHSRLDDTWHPAYAKWFGRFPGLGDDGRGGRLVRWAAGLNQVIVTPSDITIATPQPNDAPWAGILAASFSWSAYDNQRLGALQLLAGCMGPCSRAESVQKFVHEDLHFGATPRGWDNQLATKWLGNVNYSYRYKVIADPPESYVPFRFANDLAIGGQLGLGNLATFAQGQLEYRFGWGLPMGFTKTPDPAGVGIMVDAVYLDPAAPLPDLSSWRFYFTVVGRAAWYDRLEPFEGGKTVNGGEHPGIDYRGGRLQGLAGAHFGKLRYSFDLTFYHYFRDHASANDWVNLSFECRF